MNRLTPRHLMRLGLMILALVLLFGAIISPRSQAQDLPQNLPVVVSFTADRESISLAEAEAGSETITLTWQTLNMSDDFQIRLYVYEISTWIDLQSDDEGEFPFNGSRQVTVRHPLNFNAPSYLLVLTDRGRTQAYSEAVVTLSYEQPRTTLEPSINSFSVSPNSVEADTLVYGDPSLNVSWSVDDRNPKSNLRFEQVLPNNSVVSVELPRRNLWIPSSGQGTVSAVYPDGGGEVVLRLSLVDLTTGDLLDQQTQQISITGTLSAPTATPRPVVQQPPPPANNNPPPANNNPPPASNNPPPVASAGAGGNFELGGHIATFGRLDIANQAGMTWVKKQVRWNRGEGVGAAQGIIDAARGNGFKILLGIVGNKDQMGDFEAYTDEFAAYLGQVAALGPDAIEVWNEPNIDREWPAGSINGGTYTTMLAKAYNAIKAANSNVIVISGAPAPTGFFGGGCAGGGCDDNVFLRQMAAAGATQYMDCIGAHYNEGIIPPGQSSGDPRGGHYSRYFVSMLNLYYNTFGGARRVCWTELGYLSPEGYGALPGGFAWAQNTSLGQQADWLGQAARLSRDSGRVRLMIVWNVDFQVYNSDPQAGYAILRADGSCPACAALAAAVR